jgi:uncharacterized protein (DUF1330 family)
MPAYLAASIEVEDWDRFQQEFANILLPGIGACGGKVLALAESAKTLEGEAETGGFLLLEFQTEEELRRWRDSAKHPSLKRVLATFEP